MACADAARAKAKAKAINLIIIFLPFLKVGLSRRALSCCHENLGAPTLHMRVGLLGFLVSSDDPAADVAAGGSSRTATECFIPAHPRATVVADLSDQAVRLMKRCNRHGLYRCGEG
jgi:hypothetical protein